ncbi:MAG TPA: peptidoglycan editing factor PgeF [Vicinamibacterales bacterium]|jgi:YfiH family protein|nr:peptidoglycan editing factor PgeF [Vicinamibacterales bacterium]
MMFDIRLPQPNDTFQWVQVASRHALVCQALRPFAIHLMTTREWALGGRPGADENHAWTEVEHAMGSALVRVRQVHGADVLVLRRDDELPTTWGPVADIVLSNNPGVAVAIQTADCVPLLIADRRTGSVAAAHAGWRGLAAGVPGVTVEAMTRAFSSVPADLIVAAGPSIGACCYEVGPDVRERFTRAGWPEAALERWFANYARPTPANPSMPGLRAPRPGHPYFDAALSTRDQLEAAGVPAGQIFLADLCTASHPGALCSYRRDGTNAGRMAATIRARIVA